MLKIKFIKQCFADIKEQPIQRIKRLSCIQTQYNCLSLALV